MVHLFLQVSTDKTERVHHILKLKIHCKSLTQKLYLSRITFHY